MSETRPVPRRESPWGRPDGDHREPKAHRCNDRAEDVIQVDANPFFATLHFEIDSSDSVVGIFVLI